MKKKYEKTLFEDDLKKYIDIQIRDKKIKLTEYEEKYLKKVSLFTYESVNFIKYSAAMRYFSNSLKILMEINQINALKNPFFQLLMTIEMALFNNFILSFSNLFTLLNPKEDTFSIFSLFKTIGKKEKKLIHIQEELPNLVKNNFKTREGLKRVYDFFENKENKEIIEIYRKLRVHIVAHHTTERNYDKLEQRLNVFPKFVSEVNPLLYELLGLRQDIDFKKLYEKEIDIWAFYFGTIKIKGAYLLSDEITDKIIDAFEKMKETKTMSDDLV